MNLLRKIHSSLSTTVFISQYRAIRKKIEMKKNTNELDIKIIKRNLKIFDERFQ